MGVMRLYAPIFGDWRALDARGNDGMIVPFSLRWEYGNQGGFLGCSEGCSKGT